MKESIQLLEEVYKSIYENVSMPGKSLDGVKQVFQMHMQRIEAQTEAPEASEESEDTP
tara:strand:- start:404 stop:577 length:174 start_codon:yes stop_codon:yes gene_type:complete